MITTDPAVAVDALSSGRLCAVPTETVYGLAAAANSVPAIAQVFEAKGRPNSHPLIVHIAESNQIEAWITDLPAWARKLVDSVWPGPLAVVGNRTNLALDCITGGQTTVAVRVPDHELTLEVLHRLSHRGVPGIVAPSANKFGHVSPTSAAHVEADLGTYLDEHNGVILDGGPCRIGVESTIVLATGATPRILRPGGISRKQITEITGLEVSKSSSTTPRVSGSLDSHYAPSAKVIIVTQDQLASLQPSDHYATNSTGFIGYREIATPEFMIRLAAPKIAEEFAQILYSALRSADEQHLLQVFVVLPSDEGVAEAIRDRLIRAAH